MTIENGDTTSRLTRHFARHAKLKLCSASAPPSARLCLFGRKHISPRRARISSKNLMVAAAMSPQVDLSQLEGWLEKVNILCVPASFQAAPKLERPEHIETKTKPLVPSCPPVHLDRKMWRHEPPLNIEISLYLQNLSPCGHFVPHSVVYMSLSALTVVNHIESASPFSIHSSHPSPLDTLLQSTYRRISKARMSGYSPVPPTSAGSKFTASLSPASPPPSSPCATTRAATRKSLKAGSS